MAFIKIFLYVSLILSLSFAQEEGGIKPERSTRLYYSVKSGKKNLKTEIEIKQMMPYRSLKFRSGSRQEIQGEYNIANPAVKGTYNLILDLKPGTNNIVTGMPLWLSIRGMKELTDSLKISLFLDDSVSAFFKFVGNKKAGIMAGGKKVKLDCLELKEADPVKGNVKKGKELLILNDPANPLIIYYKGNYTMKLEKIVYEVKK